MQWKPYQLEANLKKAGINNLPPVILVYGDDSGSVREKSDIIIKHIGVPLDDPFAADRIDINDILNTPSRLLDAAGTVSLMGGLRLIKVEGVNGDLPANSLTSLANTLKDCLKANLQDVVIVIPAPRVGKDTPLARAVERDKTNGVAIRCFQDNARDLTTFITQFLSKEGKNINATARTMLLENLGADRDITRRELEKLIIYAGDNSEISAEDVTACLVDAPASNVFKLCDMVGGRNPQQADRLLTLLMEEGEDVNMLFTMVLRHLRRILQVKESVANGNSPSNACKALRPPIMFNQDSFIAQVNRNPLPRLQKVVDRALELQFQTRDLALPAEIHLRRGIVALSC